MASVGHYVAHELSGKSPVLSFWILHGRGATANPWLPPPATLEPLPDSVEGELLERVGRRCLVPVYDDHQLRTVTAMHNQPLRCRFSQQVDALVFVPEVSPLAN